MAGRRLVDAAKLLNASKSIAHKHVALRSNQFEVYNKTSSLAKAVKNQTDRVTLTAAAAIALSQRFSEEAPAYARAAAERATGTQHETIPRQETVRADMPTGTAKTGVEQDHHYNRSAQNTATGPPPKEELEIKQKAATRHPLPDGTIPAAGLTLEEEGKGQDTFSERPVSEIPKAPLAEDHERKHQKGDELKPIESTESTIPVPKEPIGAYKGAEETIPAHANDLQRLAVSPQVHKLQEGHDRDVFYSRSVESQPPTPTQPRSQIPAHAGIRQPSDEHVEDDRLNQDVFYSTRDSEKQGHKKAVVSAHDEVPEGINTDIFHSRKVARMLGSDPFSRKDFAEERSTGRHPLDDRPLPKNTGRHPLDDRPLPRMNATPDSQPSNPLPSAQPTSSAKEMEDLASQLAQDVQSNIALASEVSFSITGVKHADLLTATP